jgi:hypothetical protein
MKASAATSRKRHILESLRLADYEIHLSGENRQVMCLCDSREAPSSCAWPDGDFSSGTFCSGSGRGYNSRAACQLLRRNEDRRESR